jgi:ribosomal protein S18 acetylase RimI-like enzyme
LYSPTFFLFFLSHSSSHPPHIHHQLEWIGVHPDATGQGCGSFLMKWAHDYCREFGATSITLEVMNANRAKGLYERKGYEQYRENDCDCFEDIFAACFIFLFLGCRYCQANKMKKDLTKDDGESAGGMRRA